MAIPVNIVVIKLSQRCKVKENSVNIYLIFMDKAHSDSQKITIHNNKDAKIVELYPSIH